MSCVLNKGHKIRCKVPGGADTVFIGNHVKDNVYVKDTGDSSGTYTTVADNGDGTVTVTATNGGSGHDLSAGQTVSLSGGAYDGNYEVLTVPTASTFTIQVAFTATDAANWSWIDSSNIIIGTSDANGTALTLYEFEHDPEKIEVKDVPVIGENNSIGFDHSVTIELYGSTDEATEEDRRTKVDQLLRGRFVVVATDENGVRRVYGAKNGLRFEEGDGGPGKEFDSLNGNIITLMGREPEPAYIYDDTGDSSGTPAEAFTAFTFV